jgi:hypothetical protein
MQSHLPLAIWVLIVLGLLCVGLVVARLVAALRALLRRRQQIVERTVIAEYAVPDKLSPAELGYVIDGTFGSNELLATIAQLYAKDAVQLTALPAGDFSIRVSPVGEELQIDDSESAVLGYLRSLPAGETRWGQMNSVVSDTAGAQADFEDAVLSSLVVKGLLQRAALASLLFRKRLASAFAALVATVAIMLPWRIHEHQAVAATGLSSGYAAIDDDTNLLVMGVATLVVWLLSFMYCNLLAYVYVHHDGVPTGATEELMDLWPDVAGFRLFLKETEFVRLQHDLNPRDPAMAYCLALGLDPGFVDSLPAK